MHALLALAAVVSLTPLERQLPLQVTPIAELGEVEHLRHTEVLQVVRDFGRPEVNIAVDAWTPVDGASRIEAVRLWWSDPIDRFPFNDRVLKHMTIDYRRVRADRWRIRVAGGHQSFAFEVALHRGRPALFADVTTEGGKLVRRCRTGTARLRARRILGIPVGLDSMVVTCIAPDGAVHLGTVRPHSQRKR